MGLLENLERIEYTLHTVEIANKQYIRAFEKWCDILESTVSKEHCRIYLENDALPRGYGPRTPQLLAPDRYSWPEKMQSAAKETLTPIEPTYNVFGILKHLGEEKLWHHFAGYFISEAMNQSTENTFRLFHVPFPIDGFGFRLEKKTFIHWVELFSVGYCANESTIVSYAKNTYLGPYAKNSFLFNLEGSNLPGFYSTNCVVFEAGKNRPYTRLGRGSEDCLLISNTNIPVHHYYGKRNTLLHLSETELKVGSSDEIIVITNGNCEIIDKSGSTRKDYIPYCPNEFPIQRESFAPFENFESCRRAFEIYGLCPKQIVEAISSKYKKAV